MQKVIRTKLADALIGAVHSSINSGNNTGRLGRLVLTAEAAGVGSRPVRPPKQFPRLLQKQNGTVLLEVIGIFLMTAIAALLGTFVAAAVIHWLGA